MYNSPRIINVKYTLKNVFCISLPTIFLCCAAPGRMFLKILSCSGEWITNIKAGNQTFPAFIFAFYMPGILH